MRRWTHLAVILLLSAGLTGVIKIGASGPVHGTAGMDLSDLNLEIQTRGVGPQLEAKLAEIATTMGAPGLFVVDGVDATSLGTGAVVAAYPSSAAGEKDVVSAFGKVRAANLVNRLSNLSGGAVERLEPTPGRWYTIVLVSRRSPLIKALQMLLLACLGISVTWFVGRQVRRTA